MENQLVKELLLGLMETSMWGNSRMGKNMVKGHTLNLREGSMKENGRMEKDGTEHSMTKKEKSLESL